MVARLIATWFGVGALPFAPGTAGSLAALPFAWAILALAGLPALLLATFAAALLGVWASGRHAPVMGRDDPGGIVIDEVAGQWLTLAGAGLLGMPFDLAGYAIAFACFRFFDIVKPWPVSWADRRLSGGLGIMADDLLAGVYAAVGTWLLSGGWHRWIF